MNISKKIVPENSKIAGLLKINNGTVTCWEQYNESNQLVFTEIVFNSPECAFTDENGDCTIRCYPSGRIAFVRLGKVKSNGYIPATWMSVINDHPEVYDEINEIIKKYSNK